jgi:aryl-alcohol dehydrogenase-like predicted oxidoreductase
VNFFDTAPAYGDGASETLLGKVLKGRRDRLVVATKISGENVGRDKLKASCEASLRRLGSDYVDLLQVHWRNRAVPQAETFRALDALRREGKVRAVGVCNYGPRDLAEALAHGRVETNQLPYSLLWRPIEHEIQPLCTANGIGILCYSPLSQGLLTGKFKSGDEIADDRARTRFFSSRRPMTRHGEPGCEAAVFAALRAIETLCAETGRPMGNVALAWLLAQPGVTAVVAGARNARQAGENLAAAELTLPGEFLGRLAAATASIKDAMGLNADMWEGAERSRIR